MEPNQKFATVGAFILVSIIGLIAFGTWLSGYMQAHNQMCYVMRFDNSVAGLSQGGIIKFRGVDVGKISTISFNPQKNTEILVKAMLNADTPIHTNTVAQLKTQGITGNSYIEMDIGNTTTVRSPEELDGCRVIPTLPSNIQEILDMLPDIVKQARVAIERINQVLAPENITAFNQTLDNLRQLSATLTSQTQVIGPQLAQGAANFSKTMNQVNGLAANLNQSTPATIQQLNQALAQAQEALAQLNGLVRDVRRNPLQALQPAAVKEEKVP